MMPDVRKQQEGNEGIFALFCACGRGLPRDNMDSEASIVEKEQKRVRRGDVCNYLGISKNALRNYEELGIVSPDVGGNGYRTFTEKDVSALCAVRMLREMGLSLPDIARLMDSDTPGNSMDILKERLFEIERQRAELDFMEKRILQKCACLEKAARGAEICERHDGPVLWYRRRYNAKSKADNRWISAMPWTAVAGGQRIRNGKIVESILGLAVDEKDNGWLELPLDEHVMRVDMTHSVWCIKECTMKNGTYDAEDYLPLFRFAEAQGLKCGDIVYTFGLSGSALRGDARYVLELFLPVTE